MRDSFFQIFFGVFSMLLIFKVSIYDCTIKCIFNRPSNKLDVGIGLVYYFVLGLSVVSNINLQGYLQIILSCLQLFLLSFKMLEDYGSHCSSIINIRNNAQKSLSEMLQNTLQMAGMKCNLNICNYLSDVEKNLFANRKASYKYYNLANYTSSIGMHLKTTISDLPRDAQ